ncbi:MAG: hypothetical protein L0K07_12555 [Yaniella sp.]|nr:hypothetical protein [Yaniella sp.]MDN6412180.1 hypothetical protein [Yaniella sp.]
MSRGLLVTALKCDGRYMWTVADSLQDRKFANKRGTDALRYCAWVTYKHEEMILTRPTSAAFAR